MTKAQLQQKLDGFMATGTPKATSVAPFLFAPGGAVAEPIKVDPIPERVRKPPTIGYRAIRPDPAKGQSFDPYVVLAMANHAQGRFHKDIKLDQLWLDTLKAFVSAHGWTLPAVPAA